MMIDSHVHLSSFQPDEMERQINIAKKLGTKLFVEVAAQAEKAPVVVDLANSRDDFYCGVAVHPNLVETYNPSNDVALFKKLIKDNKRIVCIGECGLDYSNKPTPPDRAENQRQLFRDMIRLAREVNLPLNMHTDRLSSGDMLKILREEKAYEVGGMIHNFGGNVEQALGYLDLGFYISVSVLIQHPLAERLRRVFRDTSVGQMVMDSDAPGAKLERVGDSTDAYPYDMDKLSEPRMLRYICDKLAEVKETDVNYMESVTALNAARLFSLPNQA